MYHQIKVEGKESCGKTLTALLERDYGYPLSIARGPMGEYQVRIACEYLTPWAWKQAGWRLQVEAFTKRFDAQGRMIVGHDTITNGLRPMINKEAQNA